MSSRAKRRNALLAVVAAWAAPIPLAAQLTPPSTGGIAALDRVLQRMAEPRRVLMIGAHPDDEDTGLLSLVALGYGADAAYLSLSRGEGGQNLIGEELGPALGLLRSQELLSARAVDGARQFFTRAFDFGYTRSLDETSVHWPPDSVLKDAVRVVRRFRPHVIVSVFSGTARDGHGQHQAAGVTALAAFEAAGDPHRFPELLAEEGLAPWSPWRLFRSTRFDPASATLELATGGLDPRTGQTFHQIAMASRSRHRSQDMGQLQTLGSRNASLSLLLDRTDAPAGSPDSAAADLFAGIPTERSPVGLAAESLRRTVDPSRPDAVAPALAELVRTYPDAPERPLLDAALATSAGLVLDGVADDDEVVPGQPVEVEVTLFNGGRHRVAVDRIDVEAPDGWQVAGREDCLGDVAPGTLLSCTVTATVPPDAQPSQPYFAVAPRQGSMYDWSGAEAAVRGEPFGPPLLRAAAEVRILDASITLGREVAYRYNDQAVGEVRREVRVVPAVDVRLEPGHVVWPAGAVAQRDFRVTLTYNGTGAYAGQVHVTPGGGDPAGWSLPAPRAFRFSRPGESAEFTFEVAAPPGLGEGRVVLLAVAEGDDGRRYDRGVEGVEYPHIRRVAWVRDARTEVVLTPLVLPALARVGYVRGAADRVPEALRQIDLPVEILDAADLAGADLGVYDAIVVGSRAYETDPALARHNGRLLEYTRAGGHLVVLYQQYAFIRGGFAPYPLDIGRPHDRVTDENAPVRLLDPDHPLFRTPNPIGPGDWTGWPQERGLYFAQTWDEAYQPLLETRDPDGPPLLGGLLVAEYGAGTYVYTGLSFFRALPQGTPGALRLFVNLLGLRRGTLP